MTEGAERIAQTRVLRRPEMNALPDPSDFNITEPAAAFTWVGLGAGVVGVTTAYWALRHGKSVCVIDRQPAAGLETSFANGGQISVSHAEPWANPSAPLKVLKWLFKGDSPLLFRPRLDVHQWLWLATVLIVWLPHPPPPHPLPLLPHRRELQAHAGAPQPRRPLLRRAHARHPAFLPRQARVRGGRAGRRADAQVRLRPAGDRTRPRARDRAGVRRADRRHRRRHL